LKKKMESEEPQVKPLSKRLLAPEDLAEWGSVPWDDDENDEDVKKKKVSSSTTARLPGPEVWIKLLASETARWSDGQRDALYQYAHLCSSMTFDCDVAASRTGKTSVQCARYMYLLESAIAGSRRELWSIRPDEAEEADDDEEEELELEEHEPQEKADEDEDDVNVNLCDDIFYNATVSFVELLVGKFRGLSSVTPAMVRYEAGLILPSFTGSEKAGKRWKKQRDSNDHSEKNAEVNIGEGHVGEEREGEEREGEGEEGKS
jgi:hypothetical protein